MRRHTFQLSTFGPTAADAYSMNDHNDVYILKQTLKYLLRFQEKHSLLNEETLKVVCWALDDQKAILGHFILDQIEQQEKVSNMSESSEEDDLTFDISNGKLEEDFIESEDNYKDFGREIFQALKEIKNRGRFECAVRAALEKRYNEILPHARNLKSPIEKGLTALKKMFNLSEAEMKYCLLIFIIWEYPAVGRWLDEYLLIGYYGGQKFITQILQISYKKLKDIESGTLKHIGVLETNENVLLEWLQGSSTKSVIEKHYRKMPQTNVGLEQHFFKQEEINHLKNLLRVKPQTSTHILFYGAPGTGKSSLAYGLVQNLKLDGYEILRGDEKNSSTSRRASILSCVCLTNKGKGSVILIDEAENILQTENSWSFSGEVRDKGWLNDLLEKPGLRIIWIVNDSSCIDKSVARRFSYSLKFKPFELTQRVELLDGILRTNKVKRFFSQSEIYSLAKKYNVSAGDIDTVVKSAKAMNTTKKDLHQAVHLGLKAKQVLYGTDISTKKNSLTKEYSLSGLNTSKDLKNTIAMLEKFDRFRSDNAFQNHLNLNMLFYGPPGGGKSAFARYIAHHLDKNIIIKRSSDLQDMYVGESEKNIRSAFEEADRTDSLLVIDEIDALLGKRVEVSQSWQISMISELLTSMEDFKGIFIATTNGFDRLDPAAIGRFRERIEFRYLTAEGNLIFYKTYLMPLLKDSLSKSVEVQVKNLGFLTPRDFSNVKNQFFFYEKAQLDHGRMIDALKDEVAAKNKNESRKNQIGF